MPLCSQTATPFLLLPPPPTHTHIFSTYFIFVCGIDTEKLAYALVQDAKANRPLLGPHSPGADTQHPKARGPSAELLHPPLSPGKVTERTLSPFRKTPSLEPSRSSRSHGSSDHAEKTKEVIPPFYFPNADAATPEERLDATTVRE